MPERRSVSVVVPTLGRDTLPSVLEALYAQTRVPDEVIVKVDAGKEGASTMRNAGFAQSSGDYVAFADDDGIPPHDWIERLASVLDAHPEIAGVGGSYVETDPLLKAIREYKQELPMEEREDQGHLVGIGGNVMFRRELLQRLVDEDGFLFDTSYRWGGEDWEIIARMRSKGARFRYVPSHIRHLKRVTTRSFMQMQFFRGRGIATMHDRFKADGGKAQQESLLWTGNPLLRYPRILWRKVLGPFVRDRFPSWKTYLQFWLGEKAQGAGFVYQSLRREAPSA